MYNLWILLVLFPLLAVAAPRYIECPAVVLTERGSTLYADWFEVNREHPCSRIYSKGRSQPGYQLKPFERAGQTYYLYRCNDKTFRLSSAAVSFGCTELTKSDATRELGAKRLGELDQNTRKRR